MTHFFRRCFLQLGASGLLFGINGSKIAEATTLKEDIFKQEVIDILRRHHPDWIKGHLLKETADPLLIEIGDQRISLHNIFRIVRDMSASERDERILGFLETVFVDPEVTKPDTASYGDIKNRLMPQLIPAQYRDDMPNLVSRPFFAGLHVGYALREEGGYGLLLEHMLAAWHVSQEDVEAQAIANLEALAAPQELVAKRGEKGAYLFIAGDDSFGAARLLAPGFMARIRRTLDVPRIFVGIPDRDFGLAWTPDFSRRQGFAEKISKDVATEPYQLTDALFVSTDKGVRLSTPDEARDHGR